MNQDYKDFIVPRDIHDRRSQNQAFPPYLTEEGFVLVDRRGAEDRRAAARQTVQTKTIVTGKTVQK